MRMRRVMRLMRCVMRIMRIVLHLVGTISVFRVLGYKMVVYPKSKHLRVY